MENQPANDRSQDTEALARRQHLNESRGSRDLTEWLAPDLDLRRGARWLDLGCGRGTLLLKLGARALPGGRLFGADVSEPSVEELRRQAVQARLPVEARTMDMDTLIDSTAGPDLSDLDSISAVYALYYSGDAPALLEALRERLRPGGRVAVVGPAPGNNAEWFDLLDSAGFTVPPDILRVSERFVTADVWPVGSRFDRACERQMINTVTIRSTDELMAYWQSNIYHDPEWDEEVRAATDRWFSSRDTFVITKRVSSVVLEVSR